MFEVFDGDGCGFFVEADYSFDFAGHCPLGAFEMTLRIVLDESFETFVGVSRLQFLIVFGCSGLQSCRFEG